MKKYILTLALASGFLQGCLDTRESQRENEEKHQLQKQVGTLQRSTADVNSKFQEVDDEVSKLSARVDVVDNKVSKNDEKIEKMFGQRDLKIKESTEKVALHQEALTKMESQLSAMQAQINQLIEEQKKAPVATKNEGGEKGQYKVAEDHFDKKQWQDAAIAFEKYRKANPKGKHSAEALYKIGVSFQELGSKDEAKIFFKDVLNQYPNTPESKKANTRLKSLK
jgi:tetratricopeptide (TPR) repeat protein